MCLCLSGSYAACRAITGGGGAVVNCQAVDPRMRAAAYGRDGARRFTDQTCRALDHADRSKVLSGCGMVLGKGEVHYAGVALLLALLIAVYALYPRRPYDHDHKRCSCLGPGRVDVDAESSLNRRKKASSPCFPRSPFYLFSVAPSPLGRVEFVCWPAGTDPWLTSSPRPSRHQPPRWSCFDCVWCS